MFTGIIKTTGTVKKRDAASLSVGGLKKTAGTVKKGASVAVNGVCLTAVRIDRAGGVLGFDIMPETWKRTSLGSLADHASVNIELALGADGRFDGHIVQGHVDGTATLLDIKEEGDFRLLRFSIDKSLGKYLVEKGSIALDGISLTLIKASANRFSVGIIPHTWEATSLKEIEPGRQVNVEIDILAKYAAQFSNKKS